MPCWRVKDHWKSKISMKRVKNRVFKSYYLFQNKISKKTFQYRNIDLDVEDIFIIDSILWRGVCEEISQPEVSPCSILKIVCQLGYDWGPIGYQLAPNWPWYTTNWVKSKRGPKYLNFNGHITCVFISKFLSVDWLPHRGDLHDRNTREL